MVEDLTTALSALVPRRRVVIPPGELLECAADHPEDPETSFHVTDRGQRIMVYGIEAAIGGARVRMTPDVAPTPGGGDVVLDVRLSGPVRVAARVEANVTLGADHGIDTDVVARIDAEWLRVTFRPYVRYGAGGVATLGLRLLEAALMRDASTPANLSNITIEFSSQQEYVSDLLQVLGYLLAGPTLTVIFENLQVPQRVAGGDVGTDVGALGGLFTAVAFSDFLGPLLFGEEIFPFLQETTLEGVTAELAVDASVGGGPVSSLGLYGRRAPPPAITGVGDPSSTASFARGIHTLGVDAACVAGLGQRSPNCLEQNASDPGSCPETVR